MNTEKIKVVYYTSDKGLYVSTSKFDYSGKRQPVYNIKKINNKDFLNTHLSGWYFVPEEKELISLNKECFGGYTNTRYELVDKSLAGESFPEVLSPEEVHEWRDDEGDYCWESESKYKSLRGLYQRKQDTKPNYYEDVDFESEYLGNIISENVENISTAKFSILIEQSWETKEVSVNLKDIAHYYELEQMLVSELLIHNRPCYLSSKCTYDIVRNYIKNNIDPKQAIITSDYDFCFTVKKKIAVKPYTKKNEILTSRGKSYRPPKFKTYSVDHKQIEIFEMTHKDKCYGSYTPIEGFKGDSLEDLANNIKFYLEEVIEYINKPVKECDCCSGTGHIIEDKLDINKREEGDCV